MQDVLIIDNYDSFTWNLVHLIGPLVRSVEVVRNDETSVAAIRARAPAAVVLSPGPCTPNEAGICLDVVRELAETIPIFGVCLGMQAIGQAFGGEVVRAPVPMHGKVCEMRHAGRGLFQGLDGPFEATRYHSLIVARETCPSELEVTAETEDRLVMALSHRHWPVHGVQFHPESILSRHGECILGNFLSLAAQWNRERGDIARAPVH